MLAPNLFTAYVASPTNRHSCSPIAEAANQASGGTAAPCAAIAVAAGLGTSAAGPGRPFIGQADDCVSSAAPSRPATGTARRQAATVGLIDERSGREVAGSFDAASPPSTGATGGQATGFSAALGGVGRVAARRTRIGLAPASDADDRRAN